MLASTYRTGPSDLSDLGVAGEPGRFRAQEQKTPRFGLPGSAPRLRIKGWGLRVWPVCALLEIRPVSE